MVRTIYVLFAAAEIPVAKEGQEIMDLADLSTPLPEWFTEEDLDAYATLYEKSFWYPLQMPYRSIHKMPNRLDARFQVPVFMVMGEKDYVFKFPGFETALRGGAMENLRAGAAPGAGQRALPPLLQGLPRCCIRASPTTSPFLTLYLTLYSGWQKYSSPY